LWSDVSDRALAQSQDFHPFVKDLTARSKSGHRFTQVSHLAIIVFDTELRHTLPPAGRTNRHSTDDGIFTQPATHLLHEFHLVLEHETTALDPLYPLSSIFKSAASTFNQVLAAITKQYEIISSTLWDQ
jgi:hypothetical protein